MFSQIKVISIAIKLFSHLNNRIMSGLWLAWWGSVSGRMSVHLAAGWLCGSNLPDLTSALQG